MANQELSKLRELSDQEILDKIKETQSELFKMKFQWKASRQLANPARLRTLKKEVARAKTVLRERELSEEVESHA